MLQHRHRVRVLQHSHRVRVLQHRHRVRVRVWVPWNSSMSHLCGIPYEPINTFPTVTGATALTQGEDATT